MAYNSSSVISDGDITPWIQYATFGATAIITNLIIVTILFRNIKYLKKSAFITGLAFGDMIHGISLTVIGTLRIIHILNGSSVLFVHPMYCMKNFITPVILMGNQVPGVIFFLVGVERFSAVNFYDWYQSKWSKKTEWILVASAYLYCTFSVVVSIGVAFISSSDDSLVSISCATSTVVGSAYSAYNYSVGIVGGTVAVIATLTAFATLITRKYKSNASSSNVSTLKECHLRDQWHLTRITLCLAVVDFGLMVTPSFLITLSSGFNIDVGNIKAWSMQLVAIRSILNIVIYCLTSTQFRIAAQRAFCLKTNFNSQIIFKKNVNGRMNKINPR